MTDTSVQKITGVITPLEQTQIINNIIDNMGVLGNGGTAVRNIGEIVCSVLPLDDPALHLLDGSLLSKNGIYDDFVDYIEEISSTRINCFTTESNWQSSVSTYGVCGKFVYNELSYTVRLPLIKGFIEATNDVSELCNIVTAGLPNILGEFTSQSALSVGNGCFTGTGTSYLYSPTANSGKMKMSFDASKSDAIYGNSNTVQPQSVKVHYYIAIATSQRTDIEVNISNITNDLNYKADKDFSNTNPSRSFISNCIRWSLPDYSASIQVSSCPVSTSQYTAPSDGLFVISGDWTSATNVYVNNNLINLGFYEAASGVVTQELNFPLAKNDKIYFTNSSATNTFKAAFVPFRGVN